MGGLKMKLDEQHRTAKEEGQKEEDNLSYNNWEESVV